MSKYLLKATLSICLLASASHVQSQTYTLTTSNGTYADLTAPNVLDESNADIIPSGSTSFAVYQPIPIGFDFEILGVSYDSLRVAQYGYVSFSNAGSQETLILAYDCRLDYFQGDSSLSSINYTLEGTPGNQIFKLEFNNYGFYEDATDTYFANFQLWLYEDCNEFEVHVGSTSVGPGIFINPTDAAPFIGYVSLEPGGESAYLTGSSSSPTLVAATSGVMSDHPVSGTIYNFSDCSVGIEENAANANFSIHPNPAEELIIIEFDEQAEFKEIIIRDIQGAELKRINIENSTSPEINIADLPAAMYFMELYSANETLTKRFIKK